jgi:hypothetical protein
MALAAVHAPGSSACALHCTRGADQALIEPGSELLNITLSESSSEHPGGQVAVSSMALRVWGKGRNNQLVQLDSARPARQQ